MREALCGDENFRAVHFHFVGGHAHFRVEGEMAGLHAKLPGVPRAFQLVAIEPAFAQRAAAVDAEVVDGVELARNIAQRDVLPQQDNVLDAAWRYVGDISNF